MAVDSAPRKRGATVLYHADAEVIKKTFPDNPNIPKADWFWANVNPKPKARAMVMGLNNRKPYALWYMLKRAENSVFRSHNLDARFRLGIDVSENQDEGGILETRNLSGKQR